MAGLWARKMEWLAGTWFLLFFYAFGLFLADIGWVVIPNRMRWPARDGGKAVLRGDYTMPEWMASPMTRLIYV